MADDQYFGKPAAILYAVVAVGVTALLILTGNGTAWWQPNVNPASVSRAKPELANKSDVTSSVITRSKAAEQGYVNGGGGEVLDLSAGARSDEATGTKLSAMADPSTRSNSPVNLTDFVAISPLHTAVIPGDFEFVAWLLANGADANARKGAGSYPGETPLHTAAYAGHTDIAELLLAYGADVNAIDRYNYTPLRRTVSEGHLALAELLIRKGADIVTRDASGMTLLHAVARTRHVALAELLITGGADINAMDDSSFTPLDYAQGGEARMVQALERYGALCTIC